MAKIYYTLILFLLIIEANSQTGKNWYHNINNINVALDGYDVVAYQTKNEAILGNNKMVAEYQDVSYYFSSEKNKKLFKKNPEKYLPEFGGWCTYFAGVDKTMSQSAATRVKPDPKSFVIKDSKLYLFVKRPATNGKKQFEDGDQRKIIANANSFWDSRRKYAARSNGLPKGMNPNARMELIEWLPFIGDWDGNAKWWADTTGQNWGGQKAEWSFYFGFDGYCIQDDWKPYNEGFFAGTTSGPAIRGYDPQNKEWHMTFIPVNQARSTTWMMTGKFVAEGKIIGTLENTDYWGRKYLQKVEFTAISGEKFSWRAHRSFDGGKTWSENMMMTDCVRKDKKQKSK